MIRDHLIPALKSEFAGWEIEFDAPPQPIASFPATQEAVGKVLVYDDGDEATICIENITHGHFDAYGESQSQEQRDKIVTEDVVDFLKALFNDRVLLFSNEDNSIGGWSRLDLKEGPVELRRSFRYFLWSRPYKT